MLKKKTISLIVLSILGIACGKHTKTTSGVNSSLNRYIDAQLEGSFSASEANMGNTFCAALAYKKNNFANMYGSGSFSKKFVFDMSQKVCDNNTAANFSQTLKYSGLNGLSYLPEGSPGVVPFVETDTNGVFSTYCAARNQIARTFTNGTEVKVYHFFSGTECGGDATQICAVYERASAADFITTNYKKYLISTGPFLSRDLKGQEVFSEEQATCNGSIQMLKHTLRQIQD